MTALTAADSSDECCLTGVHIPGGNVISQEQTLELLGRTTGGYFDTDPDGDCAVVASIQTKLYNAQAIDGRQRNATAVKREALARCAHVRRLIEQAFCNNTGDIQQLLPDRRCAAYLRDTVNAHVNETLPDDGSNWRVLASLYGRNRRDGGVWLNEPAIRALAIVLMSDIVVVSMAGPVTVFPKHGGLYHIVGTNQHYDTDTDANYFCSTRRGGVFIPATAFDPSTIVICHDSNGLRQGSHFWCTRFTADVKNVGDLALLRTTCSLPVKDVARVEG